jgi:HAD superfamily hydrolase (TIGR01509 family)
MIRAIVFDFDGVLADSETLHLRATQEVLARRGMSLSRDDYYSRYLGYDDPGMFAAYAADRGLPLPEEDVLRLVAEKSEVFAELEADGSLLYPGAAECVRRLGAEFPLGIASGAQRHEIEHVLATAGLLHAFRFIVASGDTPASKPAPDPYRRAAVLHGVAPEACAAIEDSRWGIESAKAAGLKCVGITHSYPRAELSGADTIIESLADFTPELVRGLGLK